ncbi:MAG TPA: phage terminase large subunit [Nitrosopumilaceae archaeon]|jgi:hypothetical protein|nr:phage terminase large subunit [Nitrosopumilaceae archaeon]
MNISLYPEPHDKQKEVLRSCSLESPNMYTIVVAGRQGGKSTSAKHQTIYWSLTYPGSRIWYVMPSEGQCRSVWRDIVVALQPTGVIKSKKASSGSIEIIFHNGTILEFKSGSSSSLRGTPINFLILDEAAFLKASVVESDILPSLNVAGRKVLICSTPKGKNWLWNFYQMGQDKHNKDYKSFKFVSTDNPQADIKKIQIAKDRAPEGIFRQEYLAEFVDGAEVFKNIDELCCLKPEDFTPINGIKTFCGIDIGLKTDETVITIIDQSGHMVLIDRFTGLSTPATVNRILEILKKWKPTKTSIETNNQGLTIFDYLFKEYKNIEEFTTTNQSKEEIVNRLIAAFSGKEIKLFNDSEIKKQLEAFIFEMTETGKVRYKAGYGHDDIVISVCLAWNQYLDSKLTGGYFVTGSNGQGLVKSTSNKNLRKLLPDNDIRWNRGSEDDETGQEFIFFS